MKGSNGSAVYSSDAMPMPSPPRSGILPRLRLALLVDDDVDGRELSAACLGAMGFETVEAANGQQALEIAAVAHPDVIVMDLEMPVMGGLEAIERLRQDKRTCDIPIVVLSANAASDHVKARRAGSALCLVKPCAPSELEGGLRAVMEGTGGRSDRA